MWVSGRRSQGGRKTHVKIEAASGHGSELLPFEFVGDADGVAKLPSAAVQKPGNMTEKSGILH